MMLLYEDNQEKARKKNDQGRTKMIAFAEHGASVRVVLVSRAVGLLQT